MSDNTTHRPTHSFYAMQGKNNLLKKYTHHHAAFEIVGVLYV